VAVGQSATSLIEDAQGASAIEAQYPYLVWLVENGRWEAAADRCPSYSDPSDSLAAYIEDLVSSLDHTDPNAASALRIAGCLGFTGRLSFKSLRETVEAVCDPRLSCEDDWTCFMFEIACWSALAKHHSDEWFDRGLSVMRDFTGPVVEHGYSIEASRCVGAVRHLQRCCESEKQYPRGFAELLCRAEVPMSMSGGRGRSITCP
jgi:hypothetical protein